MGMDLYTVIHCVHQHTLFHTLSLHVSFNYTNRCAFFSGEIDKPAQGILQRGKRKAVNVGICLDGVYVMDVKEKVSSVVFLVHNKTCHMSHIFLQMVFSFHPL